MRDNLKGKVNEAAQRFKNAKNNWGVFIILAAYAVLIYLYQLSTLKSFGVDWQETYYPAVSLLLHGQNPYQIPTLYNPVWGLFPLIPFALFGVQAGQTMLFFTAFIVYLWIARKLGGNPLSILFFMLSPLLFYNLMLGNIDWLVLIGLIIPPPLGLFFLVLKPQIGFAPILYWLWVMYTLGGARNVIKTFLPVTLCLAASFLIFGNWIVNRNENLVVANWNLSMFPWGIPIGLFLLYQSRKKINHAVSASPFFSPYLSLGTWSIAQLGAVDNLRVTFGITVTLWIIFFAGRLAGY